MIVVSVRRDRNISCFRSWNLRGGGKGERSVISGTTVENIQNQRIFGPYIVDFPFSFLMTTVGILTIST